MIRLRLLNNNNKEEQDIENMKICKLYKNRIKMINNNKKKIMQILGIVKKIIIKIHF